MRRVRQVPAWILIGLAALICGMGLLVLTLPLLGSVWLWNIGPYINPQPNDAAARAALVQTQVMATAVLVQVIGGALLLLGLYYTARTLRLNQEGQITDRYSRAIEQLGATDDAGRRRLEIRLGGIYALERIARDSPRDHGVVMEVLTAYVRTNAPWPPREQAAHQSTVTTDIQAILTVLGRRNVNHERQDVFAWIQPRATEKWLSTSYEEIRGEKRETLDLSYADLRGADLSYANLAGTLFFGSNLNGANLWGTNLQEANLSAATLVDTRLDGANLSNALIGSADFTDAFLSDTNLSGVYLDRTNFEKSLISCVRLSCSRGFCPNFLRVNLKGAKIAGTDLGMVEGLAQQQIDEVEYLHDVQLPSGLTPPVSREI